MSQQDQPEIPKPEEEQLDQAIVEGLSLCRGVLQRYLAYLQGLDPLEIFPEIQLVNEVGFKDNKGKYWFLKLDIVDDPMYKFPLEKCQGYAVRDMMAKIINNLHLATQYVLKYDFEETQIDLPRPELFTGSRIAVTPFTTSFLYNDVCGKEIHDSFPKRIGFVWTVEGSDSISEPNTNS